MEWLMERMADYANLTKYERQELLVAVQRFTLAGMESGNPSAVRTVLREYAEFDAQAAYSIRAQVVGKYGQDI